jgi:hypothetical protein
MDTFHRLARHVHVCASPVPIGGTHFLLLSAASDNAIEQTNLESSEGTSRPQVTVSAGRGEPMFCSFYGPRNCLSVTWLLVRGQIQENDRQTHSEEH